MNAASPDQCYFIEYQKIKDKWGMTDFQEVTVLKDVVDLPDCGVGVALVHPMLDIRWDDAPPPCRRGPDRADG